MEVLQKFSSAGAASSISVPATADGGIHGAASAAAAPSKLVLRRGAEQPAGGVVKRRRKDASGD